MLIQLTALMLILAQAGQDAAPASQPSSAPASRKPAQAAVYEALLRSAERTSGIRPEGISQGRGLIEKDGVRLIAEGTQIVWEAGVFVQREERGEFHFDSSSDLAPMAVLPNSWLEWMEDLSVRGVNEFLIRGEVTTYRGQNLLLVHNVRRRVSNGNLSP